MALKELLGTDIGLLSMFTIGFVVVMAVFLISYAKKKMDEDARKAK